MATVEHLCVHTTTESLKHGRPKAVHWRTLVAGSKVINTTWMDIGCIEDQVRYLRISLKQGFPCKNDGLSAGNFQHCVRTEHSVPIPLSQATEPRLQSNPVHGPKPYLFTIQFNITLLHMPSLPNIFFSFLLFLKIQFYIHFSSLPYMWPAV